MPAGRGPIASEFEAAQPPGRTRTIEIVGAGEVGVPPINDDPVRRVRRVVTVSGGIAQQYRLSSAGCNQQKKTDPQQTPVCSYPGPAPRRKFARHSVVLD